MKIASQILKKIITVTFDSSLLLFPYVDIILLAFALSKRRKRSKYQSRSIQGIIARK